MNIDLGLSVTKGHVSQTKVTVLEHRVGHKEFFNFLAMLIWLLSKYGLVNLLLQILKPVSV